MTFDLDKQQRKTLFNYVIDKIESFYASTEKYSISPNLDVKEIRNFINKSDFDIQDDFKQAINHVVEGLEEFSVHTPHPKYFGLFNPRANFSGILADLITAAFNPQLAAWSHAPFAVEVEAKLIQDFGLKFGYAANTIDGVFTTGGAEANLTAVLSALNLTFPEYAKTGLIEISQRPIIYCSQEAHHSINKAAKSVGLGHSSVQNIPIDKELKLDINSLKERIEQDSIAGNQPLMIIGTAGTTGTGTIDNLPALGKIADKYNLWFHVDAAYGGGAVLNGELKSQLKGIEMSDSITFDAHKWMSVPMGTSLFLTSHKKILGKTFRTTTEYMPKEAKELDVVDPFTHSIQWSRRFVGLRLYLSLLFFGWDGYENVVGHQSNMGNLLRKKLIDSGKSWISVYPINQIPAFRACITNYSTTEKELDEFVEEINEQREKYKNKYVG